MSRDGDGWTECTAGHRHWGRYGAAGLLLTAPGGDGAARVLLQHRAAYSHHGDTWGVPGGARGRAEPAEAAALREAAEETGLNPGEVVVASSWVDDHGGWAYTTVLAAAPRLLEVHAEDRESTAVAWVPVPDVELLDLHPGFAASWPVVRDLLPDLRG
ncbi:MAG: 8-oxo-dGTP diphosphatase [Frankiales bacterium]|nr:8-oxo-dGTP diphosphatase [Frankiales bacterium]